MIGNTRHVALLVDSSKVGKPALMEICALREIDVLITDREAPEPFLAAVRAAGVRCELV